MIRRAVWAWALFVPLAHLPSLVIGAAPAPIEIATYAIAVGAAFSAAWALGRTDLLERIGRALDPWAGRLLAGILTAYTLLSLAGAASRLGRFSDSAMLGLFSQSYWTQLHGHLFANSQEAIDGTLVSHFGLHFSPTLLLLTPFFALWPKPITLMAAQIVVIALAPVPLYFLLRRRVPPTASLLLSLALLAMPVYVWSGFADFRDSSFLPVLLLASLWAMDARRWGWFAAFALAALGTREDVGLAYVAIGAYALVSGVGPRAALAIAGAGAAWFALVPRIFMRPLWTPGLIMDPQRFFVSMFGQWGATPLRAGIGVLTHPLQVVKAIANGEALRYLHDLLTPLLVLPPFLDWAALGAAPALAVNLLSAAPFMRSATNPYALAPLAFLALATGLTAARLAGRANAGDAGGRDPGRQATALALGVIVLAGTLPAVAFTRPGLDPNSPPLDAATRVVAALPRGVPVYAPIVLYPYAFDREHFDCWWNAGKLVRDRSFRSRYRAIVLWPASDPPGDPREQAVVDSLATDSTFVERPGFTPFRFYERR
jgi:uncharacterized membrane protein